MAQESIFHKLIKNENSYTQLLCNILKRDENFRNDFFSLIGVAASSLNAVRIQAQRGLGCHGQADILIQSSTIYMIIEVKTESLRSMTDNQFLSTPQGYLRWLEQKMTERTEGWLIYLIPANWSLLEDKRDEILKYQRGGRERWRSCRHDPLGSSHRSSRGERTADRIFGHRGVPFSAL